MSVERLESAVPDGEALRFHTPLRSGGRVGLTDERLLVVDEETTSVALDQVESVEFQPFDYFLGVLSVVLVGFGVYSTRMHVAGGLAFAAAGLASLYLTLRKRGEVSVSTWNRPKPLTFHAEDVNELEDEMAAALERYEERRGE